MGSKALAEHVGGVEMQEPASTPHPPTAAPSATALESTLADPSGSSAPFGPTVSSPAAATSPLILAAQTRTVTAASVASTTTEPPVTDFPWTAGDEALFLLLLNTSGGLVGSVGPALTAAGNSTALKLCSDWEPAQHNLFQAANLFFAVAFLVPRSFKQSILVLRTSLAVGFCVSAFWAALTLCAADMVAWSAFLSIVNAAHALRLAVQVLPPRLSPDLLELYERQFGPHKVEKHLFQEMTREGRLLTLDPGDTYAIEDITPANDRLSVLLRGKLRVSCDQTYLHFINPQQFVDSPEWEASRVGPNHVFQVTITAEEESTCLCWSKPKLENVFRLRPLLEVLMINLIGKDITHKLYSMNEHLLSAANAMAEQQAAMVAAARLKQQELQVNVPWHEQRPTSNSSENMFLPRSLSLDAVHTGSRGHVRSMVWRARQQRKNSMFSDNSHPSVAAAPGVVIFPMQNRASPVRKANHFPETSPFVNQFRRKPTPAWVKPPPVHTDSFSFSPSSAQASSSRGPSFFTYPAIQQPLAASGLLIEPPIGVTPSPIVAAMAASVGGLLRLPPHAPPPPASPGRKEVSFVEESAV
ncbi:blood vessel epicardial substance-like [Neocloeon triangulifer]|uniref:blood vessel epicardial substance-like n=1 Tax=Neocloeon triangulifer TaxID=2078957 RepID=UPI00286F00EB|nr:blood vessel epicardial substance-like [Neocloeon triangulifer]